MAPTGLRSRLLFACLAALVGAAAGAAASVAVYVTRPAVSFEMDRDFPVGIRGFYPPEKNGEITFAWTGRQAEWDFQGADRGVPWTCAVRVVNWRPPSAQPVGLRIAANGLDVAGLDAVGAAEDISFTVPPSTAGRGLRLVMVVSSTFRPGADDPRDLGLAVDRLTCAPERGRYATPPPAMWSDAALAAAAVGAAIGVSGVPAWLAVLMTSAVAMGQAFSLSTGWAPFDPARPPVPSLAIWMFGGLLALAWLLRTARRQPLSAAARVAMALAAIGCYIRLLFLLHPEKLIVDAVFHAHRFEWVLAGRFYFTQLSTSATPFPYAIGLYLASAPFALLTHDYVMLLRVVVCVVEAIAGGLLYYVIVRSWGDRVAGLIAVMLFYTVPVSYVVIGNANLTSAFGQSVSVLVMALVAVWPMRWGRHVGWLALTALITLALISHVGTVTFLPPALIVSALAFWRLGGTSLKTPARAVALAAAAAVVFAIVLYWGHFTSLYRSQLSRVRADSATAATLAPQPGASAASSPDAAARPELGKTRVPLHLRAIGAVDQTRTNLGWPVILLALVGAWLTWVRTPRDQLGLTLAAWGATALLFLVMAVLSAADRRYQQDAWEFIGRVEHAAMPVAVILAGRAAAWGWRQPVVARVVSGVLVSAAFVTGARALGGWLH